MAEVFFDNPYQHILFEFSVNNFIASKEVFNDKYFTKFSQNWNKW